MKFTFLLCFIFSLFSVAHSMPLDVKAHFSINGSNSFHIMPGVPTTIEVYFTDPRSEKEYVYKEFKEMHGKYMHMVLMKSDMSVFKHIHPYFDPITGRFMITINMPLSDPDNFHTKDTIIEPGMYMLMADVEIKGVGMRMGHSMIHVHGPHTAKAPILNTVINNIVQSTFKANNNEYKVMMKHDVTYGCSTKLVNFEFTLLTKNENGKFAMAKDIEPWLKEGAHSVWVSENFMNHHGHNMHYAHMHSEMPVDDSVFYFSFQDNKVMKPGIQKIFVQIKHKGQILTIPLVFEYYPPAPDQNC